MTTTFRIEQIQLDTTGGPVIHSFSSDLTVLAGPTGVGKTSLLELAKFALGGDGLVASVAEENVSLVHIIIRIGSERYQLSRSVTRVGCTPICRCAWMVVQSLTPSTDGIDPAPR